VAADALYAAVAEAAVRSGLAAGIKPQDLANTVWAYATAGLREGVEDVECRAL